MKPECSETLLKCSRREASFVKREARDGKRDTFFPSARYVCLPSRNTFHASPFMSFLPRFALRASRFTSNGFTLIEMLGVLAVLAILGGLLAPQVVKHLDVAMQDEEAMYLQDIAEGVELYVRDLRAWPASWPTNPASLSPTYVPISAAQIGQNARGFTRYYYLHPDFAGLTNSAGITAGDLPNARFLLISNLRGNENPTITNAAEFDGWWNTDTTTTPDLIIHREHFGKLFHLVSLSAVGDGGSYQVDGTATNSGGGRLTSYGRYHVTGTDIELDEASFFSVGNAEQTVILTSDAGYQFDPDCPSGSQWNILGSTCST